MLHCFYSTFETWIHFLLFIIGLEGHVFLSPDASSKGTIEMGVVRPCVWFPDDNL